MAAVASREVRVDNDLGLHLRAAGALVQVASRFAAHVTLCKGDACANAKSIMSVLALAAGAGTVLTLRAEGADAEAAVVAIADLVAAKFVTA